MALEVDTHTHTLWQNESDFKKPATGRRAPGLKTYLSALTALIQLKQKPNGKLCHAMQLKGQILPALVVSSFPSSIS